MNTSIKRGGEDSAIRWNVVTVREERRGKRQIESRREAGGEGG